MTKRTTVEFVRVVANTSTLALKPKHYGGLMDKTIVHCNVQSNAELIARILDADVDGKEYLCIEEDGTLFVDLPIPTEKVGKIDLFNSDTNAGGLYYLDEDIWRADA